MSLNNNTVIITGGKAVIASEHFFTADLDPFIIRLHYENDFVDIIVTFENSEQSQESNIIADSAPDGSPLIAILYTNFDNSAGTYNRNVYKIGHIGKKELFLRSKISRPYKNANFREVSLTFYINYKNTKED